MQKNLDLFQATLNYFSDAELIDVKPIRNEEEE